MKKVWRKNFSVPKSPGIRKWNRLQNSSRLFSIGVPVRHSRWRACSLQASLAACERGFLIFWASSRIT
ncbi:hypothetical protein D3C72_1029390 [compost metagenome]